MIMVLLAAVAVVTIASRLDIPPIRIFLGERFACSWICPLASIPASFFFSAEKKNSGVRINLWFNMSKSSANF